MKKYIDELLLNNDSRQKLPLCVQSMKMFTKNESNASSVKLVYGKFYNAAIEVKPYYKPVSKFFEPNTLPV